MVYRSVLSLIATLAVASSSLAQNYPLPGKVGAPAVVCTGCSGNNAVGEPNSGKPTYAYGSPLSSFVGRLVDSNDTISIQHIGMRTARAGMIRTVPTTRGSAPPRVYVAIGEALGAYSLSTFFTTKLPGGTVPISNVDTGSRYGNRNPLERITMFDAHVYPESTHSGGWSVPVADNQDRLIDFDFDDRGLVYLAYDEFGWGLVTDNGMVSGGHLPLVVQVTDVFGIEPRLIFSIKANSRYYAFIGNPNSPTQLAAYDVTTASTPTSLAMRSGAVNGVIQWAKNDDASVVALVNGDGKLRIYGYNAFVSNGAALDVVTASAGKYFKNPTFDDQGNLWILESSKDPSPGQKILKFTPSGASYTMSTFTPYPQSFAPRFMHASAGYLAVGGTILQNNKTTNELYLFKIEGSNLRQLETDFFRDYYHSAPSGYAQPGIFANTPMAVQIIKYGTKTYLMYNVNGLGDVFQLGADGPQLSTVMKTTSFGTTNPNAQPTQAGPFPGDVVTFNATVLPVATHTLNWNFGNPDAGSANARTGTTAVDITHQFTGLNTSSKVTTPKTVSATSTADSEMTSSVSVILKAPEPRIAIKATGELITASGFEAIYGDKFVDASDGSIESHVATWNVSAAQSVLRPDQEVSVGALGLRSVAFTGSYGKYDSGTMAIPSLAYVTTIAAKGYEVLPFLAKLKAPTRSGTILTYGATARFTTDTSVLSATQWTVHWTLKTGAVETASSTNLVAVGTVPNFSFDKALLLTGSVVKLEISVDTAGVSDPAYVLYDVSTFPAVLPDPVIQLTNCGFVNNQCSIKAVSASGASTAGWALSWIVQRGATQVTAGTGNPLATFTLNATGNYTVSVTETVFDTAPVSQGFTVDQSQCGPPPTEIQLAINASCSPCSVGTSVAFSASLFGYTAQACDVYTWTIEGQNVTGASTSHTFNSSGTYQVKLKVSNPSNPTGTTLTKNITVSGPVETCAAPTSVNFSYSNAQGCSVGTDCKTGQSISFSATKNSASLKTCDSALWTFGDGGTSGSKSATHTYSTPGTYTVTLVVSNSVGTSPTISKTISIVQGSGSCAAGPTEANVSLAYQGKETGCAKSNTIRCKAGEQIDFSTSFFQYVIQGCDRFEWNFNDGSATSTVQNPSHTFPSTSGDTVVSLKVYNTSSPNGVTLQTTVKMGPAVPAKPLPVLSFLSFPTSGAKGSPVTFTVNSNINATGWVWTFGDGQTDSTQTAVIGTTTTIQHTYATSGTYSVSVKARNSDDVASAQTSTALGTGLVISDIPEYKFLLPVVTHGAGQNNSVWRTDVQIYNPDPNVSPQNPMTMTATLRDIHRTLEVFNSTFTYEDFMRVFTTANDSGPVIITVRSRFTPQIWTRTYNQTETGTFGQFIPAIRIDAAAGSASAFGDGKYYMAGLRHDSRFRTNLGFVNPNAQTINATVKVYDDNQLLAGQFTLQLPQYQLDQFPINAAKGVPNLPQDRPFSVEIEVPPGQWLIAYASFIDSASNDPVYIQAIRESELSLTDYRQGIIPGVGHVGEWRSDITIFNPDAKSIVVDLAYHDQTGAKVAEAKNVLIHSSEFLQYADFLKQGILGNVPDSIGILRVTVPDSVSATRFPLTFARTYNDKGTGKTFGQGIGGFAAARANVKPNKPALVPGIRSNSKYYTNVGLTNVSAVAVVATVKLLDPTSGAEQVLQTHNLQPNQSVVGRVVLPSLLETGSLKIEVTGGNVWAFASIVDIGTTDPEYVAATPLP